MVLKIPQFLFDEILLLINNSSTASHLFKICYVNKNNENVFCLVDKEKSSIICQHSFNGHKTKLLEGSFSSTAEEIERMSLPDILAMVDFREEKISFDPSSFQYYENIYMDQYIFCSANIGEITLTKSDYGNFVEYSIKLNLCNMDAVSKYIFKMLIREELINSDIDEYSIMRLIKNDASYCDVFQHQLNEIFEILHDLTKKSGLYNVKVLGGSSFIMQSNIENLKEEINRYFNNYAITEDVVNFEKPDIISVESNLLRRLLEKLLQDIEYTYRYKIINHPELVSRGERFRFYDINNEYIVGQKVFCGPLNNEWSFYLYDRKHNIWYLFLKEHSTSSEIQCVPRMVRALIPYNVQKKAGCNLHAASLVLENKWSILVIGDKQQGKTTNMFMALSFLNNVDFQSNDQVFLLDESRLKTYGSHIPVGIRIGTILMNKEIFQKVTDPAFTNNLRSIKNGYGYQYSSAIKNYIKDDSHDNFTISFTPGELVALVGKRIVPQAELLALVQPIYDKHAKDFQVEKMTIEAKRKLIINNQQAFYNGVEPFWNKVFNYYTKEHYSELCVSDSLLAKIDLIPGYIIKTNQNNIESAWKYFYNEYLSKLNGE